MLVRSVSNFEQWRRVARPLLTAQLAPHTIEWRDARREAGSIPAEAAADPDPTLGESPHSRSPRISASLLRLLETVSMFRHDGRWELLYRLAWRSMVENPQLLDDAADPDVYNALSMERAVNRDVHKMHAFVRFREVIDAQGHESYFAWFEPQHEILRRGAQFFVGRFPNMDWTVATPDGAAAWTAKELRFIEPPAPAERPTSDDVESLWRTYYRNICNVARINPAAMQREMPRRYWRHLPETAEIEGLIRDGMPAFAGRQQESQSDGIPMTVAVKRGLPAPPATDESPQNCRRCDLWKHATQAVEGEGAAHARIMLVGEQPGDEEDLRGHPFVGPAGHVLDQAIAAAGLSRQQVFITNAVKHFKWEPRGKRRLHKKPGVGEINACNVWLEREIARVKPAAIVALGASALRALTGATLTIDGARQQELKHPTGAHILATYHPSAVLRAEGERAEELRGHLESDLRRAARLAAQGTH